MSLETPRLDSEAATELAGALRGDLLQAGDDGYDEARAVYNGMIDRRPLLIARCVNVADVIASVNFAREHDLEIAIRGVSHNGQGLAMVDDGLVIDLSEMTGVLNRATTAGLSVSSPLVS
jgi:FAD/FMN-containing dehydrogenase